MRPTVRLLIFSLLVVHLIGCGGAPVVRGMAPVIQVNSLSLDGDNLTLELLISNHNDNSLHLSGARLHASVDETELFRSEWPLDLNITARGRERVQLEVTASPAGRETLDELTAGDRRSVSYHLQGELAYDRRRASRIDQTGFLHRVPGQPDRFR